MASARFNLEPVSAQSGEYLHFYGVFVVFHKISNSTRSQFSKSWTVFFPATRTPKRGILIQIYNVFSKSRKKARLQNPSLPGGGGQVTAPRASKMAQNLHFYGVFLSCIKVKKWPRNRISRGQVANFLRPRVPKGSQKPAFLRCFLVLNRKKT